MSQEHCLSWDFFGPTSPQMAEHFARHLTEFLRRHELSYSPMVEPHEGATSVHLRVLENDAEGVRRALRPRRTELVPPSR